MDTNTQYATVKSIIPPNAGPLFTIGESVNVDAFTDSRGTFHPERIDLHVWEIELVDSYTQPSWYRVTAIGENGVGYFAASERFFSSRKGVQS
jgi:hypothetical protein